ncbi:MAG: hypothetical protein V3T55_08405 [Anaerolineales bacterium]
MTQALFEDINDQRLTDSLGDEYWVVLSRSTVRRMREAWVFETCTRDDLHGIAVAEDGNHNQASFGIAW